MSPDDIPSTKNSSIFLSLFSRKKRSNRSVTESSDDSKKVSSPSSTSFLTNGKANSNTNITHANGFSNFKNSETLMVPLESASTSWANEFQPPQPSSFQQQQQLQQCEPARTDFTFTDHKRYHKNSRMHQPENSTSSQSNFLSNVRSRSESRSMLERSPILSIPKKAYSVGAVNHSDPGYLMEALETLADAQPRVARSIPKHAIVDTSGFAARSLDNCLFDATVYDAMLHDSLKVFLQLNIC
uniref:Ovate family protein n=1 Tax=Elaeophora elaphi TaxID=1147741 RepID=A0A0R3RT84_9BILA